MIKQMFVHGLVRNTVVGAALTIFFVAGVAHAQPAATRGLPAPNQTQGTSIQQEGNSYNFLAGGGG